MPDETTPQPNENPSGDGGAPTALTPEDVMARLDAQEKAYQAFTANVESMMRGIQSGVDKSLAPIRDGFKSMGARQAAEQEAKRIQEKLAIISDDDERARMEKVLKEEAEERLAAAQKNYDPPSDPPPSNPGSEQTAYNFDRVATMLYGVDLQDAEVQAAKAIVLNNSLPAEYRQEYMRDELSRIRLKAKNGGNPPPSNPPASDPPTSDPDPPVNNGPPSGGGGLTEDDIYDRYLNNEITTAEAEAQMASIGKKL